MAFWRTLVLIAIAGGCLFANGPAFSGSDTATSTEVGELAAFVSASELDSPPIHIAQTESNCTPRAECCKVCGDRKKKLRFRSRSEYGHYVKCRYGPGTSFTEVQAHPLHVFASGDLTGLKIDPSKDGVVVGDVPHRVADFLEPDVLARERVAQEVLTGESKGSAGTHCADLEVAGVLGLPEAIWILFR